MCLYPLLDNSFLKKIYYSLTPFIIQVYIDDNVCSSFSPSILKFPLWEWLEETDMGICGYYRILVTDSLCWFLIHFSSL